MPSGRQHKTFVVKKKVVSGVYRGCFSDRYGHILRLAEGKTSMKTPFGILICMTFAGIASAQTSSAPSLSGTWVLGKDSAEKLVVEQTPEKIHVKEMKGDSVRTEYTCNLDGKDCSIKEDGHSAKVALWFNGPKLVELRTRGSEVTRRRFTLAGDGKSLQVELEPMSTPGKTEILAYSR